MHGPELGDDAVLHAAHPHLMLCGGWRLIVRGRTVPVPLGAQRLTALLALAGGPLPRSHVAGTLWPDGTDGNALGNLRATLSRLRRLPVQLVVVEGSSLALSPTVRVDVDEVERTAHRALTDPGGTDPRTVRLLLGPDLLAGWYDEWVVVRREQVRQLVLHALEAVSERLCEEQRYAEALQTALATLHAEPLRESAHRAVIRVHLAEGNPAEVMRQFELYRTLLRDELGVAPSRRMVELVEGLTVGARG